MFEGQIWWVTGASSGIGEALAIALSAKGASLILSGRQMSELERVAGLCGKTLILPFEATDYAAISAVTERAWNWCGRVNGIINNAGISQRSLAIESDFSVYERMIAVDLLGPIALTQANLPLMIAAGGGHIVAMSSVAGIAGVAMRSAYCAAKHGLIGYHDAVRAENEHLGVQVHVIAPGSIRTNVSRNALNGDGSRRGVSDKAIDEAMPANEAAGLMLDAIAAGKREIILATGVEGHIAALRRSDPDAAFDLTNAAVRAGYAQKMAADQNG
jgi:dehydrogenase/reductase SDR family member 7B